MMKCGKGFPGIMIMPSLLLQKPKQVNSKDHLITLERCTRKVIYGFIKRK